MKIFRSAGVIALNVAAACVVSATDRFVSPSGSDSNSGTDAQPWASLRRALDSVGPGDTVFMRGGRYHEKITKDFIKGTPGKPITIRSYPGETVVIDGTVPLKNKWRRYKKKVFVTDVDEPMWQLFFDGEMMIPARWPNARFDDDSVFSRGVWARGVDSLDKPGVMINDDAVHNLTAMNVSVDDSIIVANVKSFKTYTKKVTSHKAGTRVFDYTLPKEFGKKHHYYYLEAGLGLLDAKSEWHMDAAANKVYFRAPTNKKPKGDIRGRVQQYAIAAKGWDDVYIEGITFFATTLRFDKCGSISVVNCDFQFPGASRRSLGVTDESPSTLTFEPRAGETVVLRNSSVTLSDSQAVDISGKGEAVIENCLFDRFDWSATEPQGKSASVSIRVKAIVRHNTISRAGSSETLACGRPVEASYNDISLTGFAQGDGAMIQIGIGKDMTGTRIFRNWLHDSPKYGFRFDAPVPATKWGTNGTAYNNVIWKAGGCLPKGDDHTIYGNTIFNNSKIGLVLLDQSARGYFSNKHSAAINNAADGISRHRKKHRLPQSVLQTNFDDLAPGAASVESMLQSPADFDFRPRRGSALVEAGSKVTYPSYPQLVVGVTPDIGAYELGADEYFIPGRRSWRASHPIPAVGRPISADAPQVMWRPAYQATKEVVRMARTPTGLKVMLTVTGGMLNVFRPTGLTAGTYYWRVDSTVDGVETRGEMWSFAV